MKSIQRFFFFGHNLCLLWQFENSVQAKEPALVLVGRAHTHVYTVGSATRTVQFRSRIGRSTERKIQSTATARFA
jgi:hypothetical protein